MRMLAAHVLEFGRPLSIVDLDVPEPGHCNAFGLVVASGICLTHIYAVSGDLPLTPKLLRLQRGRNGRCSWIRDRDAQ